MLNNGFYQFFRVRTKVHNSTERGVPSKTVPNLFFFSCCSFDCHDPGVYTSSTVTGLLEHYKDPACVMFFEPALTLPLNRNFCFSLQQLCRATIVSHTSYDGVADLSLPNTLKSYLKEYHYKQRVRVKRYDEPTYIRS